MVEEEEAASNVKPIELEAEGDGDAGLMIELAVQGLKFTMK